MNKYRYEKAEEKDIEAICPLVSQVYDSFVSPHYTKEGNYEFYKYLEKSAIEKRLTNNHFILLCKNKESVIGVIEIRNFNHISMLFVDASYQGQGIAKKLLSQALKICTDRNPHLNDVSVHASPNAVAIYEKLGFKKTKEEQVINGIRFTPMVLPV